MTVNTEGKQMGKIVSNMSMSLDGYITGPDDSVEHPMGVGGMRLHEWMSRESGGPVNAEVIADTFRNVGAVVIGRRMFDHGEGPWETNPYPAPVFVVTHRAHDPITHDAEPTISFVTDGLGAALERAQRTAGDRDVLVDGGADTLRQVIGLGLLDELTISVIPVLLGEGKRLFNGTLPIRAELEPIQTVDTSAVTHLRYRVVKNQK